LDAALTGGGLAFAKLAAEIAAIAGEIQAGADVWSLPPWERGLWLENESATAQWSGFTRLPPGYPTFDFVGSTTAVSVKTLDTTAATYQSLGALRSRVSGYISNVTGDFTLIQSGVTIESAALDSRIVNLILPAGRVSDAQLQVLEQLVQSTPPGITLQVSFAS
jgi:hypothetical protein